MSIRPGRPAAGALVHLLLPVLAAGMGRATGAAWLFVLAAVLAVSVAFAVLLPLLGVARSRVVGASGPSLAEAGRQEAVRVESRAGAGVAVALVDRGTEVGRWSAPAGRCAGTVPVVFSRRGRIEVLAARVHCAGPFGLWSWVRRQDVRLAAPVLVAPAAAAMPPPRAVRPQDDLDGAGTVERRGGGSEVRGVRPWADGDAVGWVHWPTTLRTGALAVRDWAPPARPLALVQARPAADPDAAAARALGEVDAALGAGCAVRLEVPGPDGGVRATDVDDHRAAAAILAVAELGPPPPPPRRRRRPRPEGIEERRAPRVLTALAMLLAAATVLGALRWPPVSTAIAVAGIPLLSWIGARTRHGRRWWITLLTAVAAIAAFVRFALASSEVDQVGGLGVLRDPLAELLIALLVIHALDTPKRRNLRFALASSTGLVIYAGALRVDPTFGWWVLAWALASGAALAALHRSELAELPGLTPLASTREQVLRRGTSVAAGILAGSAAALALLAVVPIPEGPSRILAPARIPVDLPVPVPGALVNPAFGAGGGGTGTGGATVGGTIGYFAFSESFDLRSRGRPDQTVVMRVRAPAPDFWRGQTFERFDGTTWFASPDIGQRLDGFEIPIPPTPTDPPLRGPTDEFVQTYFVEQDMPNLLFAAYRPERVFLDAALWARPDGALRADVVLGADSIYTVVSRRPVVTEEALRAQGGPGTGRFPGSWGAADLAPYRQVPASTPQRVRDLAVQLTAPHPAVVDKVRAIEGWLAANVEYDLDAPVPPPGADAVDHFLFESRLGFCEQIASALAVLLREVGVPTRVVAGYTPGRWDPFAGVWVVEAQNAHAWVEVWFPETGWQAFDPTADVPLSGDTVQRGSLGGPIAEAAGQAILAGARILAVAAPVVLVAWLAVRWWRRRRDRRRHPVGEAQARFERLAHRCGVPVADADANPAIADRLGTARPEAAEPARRAAQALDAAAFGGADVAGAADAVRELADALR